MNKRIFILAVLGLSAGMVFGQPWLQNRAESPVSGSGTNVYELRQAFDNWFRTHDQGKGTGYKQYQRYLAFMEPRVYPTGEFSQGALWKASQAVEQNRFKSGNSVASWTLLGPVGVTTRYGGSPVGVGRINCIAFHPTDPNTFYVGAPSGGVWKTTNGGTSWRTTTDLLPALGISDIGINPLEPNILYVVTGDKDAGNTCPTYSFGILKSTDAGETWNATGLVHEVSSNIRMRRILVHPATPDIIITAGSPGIFRSTDAGLTWTQVANGDYIDLEFKPTDPSVVYASTWNAIFKSTDTGQTFTKVTQGLPSSGISRIEMAVTKANPNVVYAVMGNSDSNFKGLYKSSDSGMNWATQSTEESINIFTDGSSTGGFCWYATALAVDQQDENIVYSGSINVFRSLNSGQSWVMVGSGYGAAGKAYTHPDVHMLAFNPLNNVCYACNDGGIYKTTDKGITWPDLSAGLSILQIYRMGASYSNPNLILEGSQDNGTFLYHNGQWHHVYGGDGMECAFDPVDPSICYASSQNGALGKSVDGGSTWRGIKPEDKGAWITPYQISSLNHNALVAGYKSVYLSTTYGNSWQKISDSLANGNYMNEITFAPSDNEWIYVSSSAQIWGTQNMGATWKNLSKGLPNLYIEGITVAASEPEKVWVALSGYSDGNKVYFSDDGGENWTNYSDGLPNVPVNCITMNRGSNYALFAGTDIGVYYRKPGFEEWVPFNDGLPNVIVNEMDINYKINKMRAATFGRGIWESPIPDDGNWPPALQLTAAEEPTQITLSWFPPKDRQPDHYNIYRDTILHSTTTGTMYTDAVENGMSYVYRVSAVYPDGESMPTNKITARGIIEVTFPYTQVFETEAHGWLIKKEPTGWQWGTGTSLQIPQLGTGNFIGINSVAASNQGKHAKGYAVMPKMNLYGQSGLVITCKYALRRWQNLDHLYLVSRTPDLPEWKTLTELQRSGTLWSWKTFTYNIPDTLMTEDVEFAFYYTDSDGIGYGAAIDDLYVGKDVSAVEETAAGLDISLYPNPTSGTFSLAFKGFTGEKVQLEILDAGGRILFSRELRSIISGRREEISIRKFAPGTYYVRLTSKDQLWMKPVVKR